MTTFTDVTYPNTKYGNGGTPILSYPSRYVFHITATAPGTLDGNLSWWRQQNGMCPHVTADLVGERVARHLPVTRSATTLRNGIGPHVGGSEPAPHSPGKTGLCLQSEICARYVDVAGWSRADVAWVARAVVWPLMSEAAAAGRPVALRVWEHERRMTWAEWLVFDGVCGHMHVPFQGRTWHGDPGPDMRWDWLLAELRDLAEPFGEGWLSITTAADVLAELRLLNERLLYWGGSGNSPWLSEWRTNSALIAQRLDSVSAKLDAILVELRRVES